MEKRHFLQMTLNSIEHEHNEETNNSTGIQCIIAAMEYERDPLQMGLNNFEEHKEEIKFSNGI